ncbi:alkaline phosphatase family protein [Halococcus sediminicola]|uniref:hypothetical protein n=1 Tax=Halococcus sediminicola TaxID=1264579 RepID=UPI001F1F304E|nr:hypothetical protein [Halococcus sediminicola]
MVSWRQIGTGLRKPRRAMQYVTRRAGIQASSRGYLGTHVLTREWDVLVLLDTCRVDALRAVADEYSFLGDGDRICSVGASSAEWIGATFDREWADELRNTAYLACNGYADFILEAGGSPEQFIGPAPPDYFQQGNWNFARASDLGRLEHIWQYEREEEESRLGHDEGHTPPRYVTDRTIAVGRESDFDRLIVHYSQPHSPYVSNALEEERELHEYERTPFEYLESGGERKRVLKAYLDDLRYVLDDVEILLSNIDAEDVVISADHGEAFGEHGVYGHPIGSLHPAIRYVPWTKTTGTDSGTYTPQFEPTEAAERDVDETLRALGYRE